MRHDWRQVEQEGLCCAKTNLAHFVAEICADKDC
jgi:hypothetical protein